MSSARPTDRLFFAVLPDANTARRVADLASRLRSGHGLKGKPLAAEHIHITVWHVGDDFFPPPDELVQELRRRAGRVEMPPFRVSFDHVMSFRNGALVLRGGDGVSGVNMLHDRLEAALDVKGTRLSARMFTPHVTLLRDQGHVPMQPIEPIDWMVSELVLVHSLLGQTTHRHVARLPLPSRRPFVR